MATKIMVDSVKDLVIDALTFCMCQCHDVLVFVLVDELVFDLSKCLFVVSIQARSDAENLTLQIRSSQSCNGFIHLKFYTWEQKPKVTSNELHLWT